MICLFQPDSTNTASNGDVVLQPTRCDVSAELNGAWSLQMEHPFDRAGRWRYILPDCILKVPCFNGMQLWRIWSTQKTLDAVTATAKPIFLDCAKEVFYPDLRVIQKTGQQALNQLMQNTRYRGVSDITKRTTAYYQYKTLAEALTGADDNSFLNRWGGEVLYDNYSVSILGQIGRDAGVEIRYGKNLTGVDEAVDYSEIVTRIYPKGYNGRDMTGHGFVDSSVRYPFIRCAARTYGDIALSEDLDNRDITDRQFTVCATQAELDAALRDRAALELAGGLDKPRVSLSVDLALLYGTAEYRMYRELEGIGLGDRIHCWHPAIGIDSVERVVSLTYDCLRKQVSKCEIGSQRFDFVRQLARLEV